MKPCPISESLIADSLMVLDKALQALSDEQRTRLAVMFQLWCTPGGGGEVPVLINRLMGRLGPAPISAHAPAHALAPTLRLIAGTQSGIKPSTKPTGKPRAPVRLRVAGVPKSEVAA